MNHTVTSEQQKVLDIVRAYVALYGEMPSMSFIQRQLGYSFPSAAQHHISALRKKGLLTNLLNNSKKTMDIPLAGSISCGPTLLAEENIEGLVSYSAEKIRHKGGQYFFLRAHGDSMDMAGVGDGDMLLVHQQPDANIGEKVIVLVGDDATCKVLERTADGLPKLVPRSTNPIHRPRILIEDFSILGVVEDVLKPERRADD